MNTKLSRTILSVLAVIFCMGIGFGYYLYLHHPAVKPNIPANNAIPIHLAIAACTLITIIAIQLYRTRRQLSTIWVAPFSRHAAQRLKATLLPGRITILSILRAIICLPFLVVIAFVPFRIGAQFGGVLDPTLPLNAWGGPSYLGATLAHAMDELIFLYIAALVLHGIMARVPTKN